MRRLAVLAKIQMQFCAILSQIHRHKDALRQAKESVRLGHLLINDMRELCILYIRQEDISGSAGGYNHIKMQNAVNREYENPNSQR